VLSVTIWLLDEDRGRLVAAGSTAPQTTDRGVSGPREPLSCPASARLLERAAPFDGEGVGEAWAEELRQLNPATFPNGGNRMCVPLRTGDRTLGILLLADRVNGAVYTLEELALLSCIGDQMTSVLLNLRLAAEVARAKELEAFRTMSAFFVHD